MNACRLTESKKRSSESLKYDQSRGLAYKPQDQMQSIRSRVSEGTGRFCEKLTNRQSRVEFLELKTGALYTWLSKNKLCYEMKVNKLTGSRSFYTRFS